MGSQPIGLEAAAETNRVASLSTQTVTVYTRHQESCPKNDEPYWKRCHCMTYLYVYRENTSRQVSAKTRSWEKAGERAQEIRDSWSPVKALQRELEERVRKSEAREVLISDAVALFLKEVERLNREEAILRALCEGWEPQFSNSKALDLSTRFDAKPRGQTGR